MRLIDSGLEPRLNLLDYERAVVLDVTHVLHIWF